MPKTRAAPAHAGTHGQRGSGLSGYRPHETRGVPSLPDPDDRHVLAAAICGHAEVIVTFNENDFPAEILAEFGVETQDPDGFISHIITLDWSAVCRAL